MLVDGLGGVDLENGAVVHDSDAVGQSHGFTSVVGDVKGGEIPIVV